MKYAADNLFAWYFAGSPNANSCGVSGSKRERILIVANSLPVSCKRQEDSWFLDIGHGGLDSILLGKKFLSLIRDSSRYLFD